MRPSLFKKLIFALLAFVLCGSLPVFAEDDALETLGLIENSTEPLVTTSRIPKPLSQTAENVTVITAADIRLLNAHTLADILVTVSGIQIDFRGEAGNIALTSIQSSSNIHVLVLLDGSPLNTLGENYSDVGLVPAQIIERIEIVKGAASSVWGQALGGVINVITKSPERSRTFGGSASASIGTSSTADTRAELTGSTGRLGYYLSGGYLGTNGMTPHATVSSNGVYTKLTWDLPDSGQLWSTFKLDRADRGVVWGGSIWDNKENQSQHNVSATLGLHKQLTSQLELELLGRYATKRYESVSSQITDNLVTVNIKNRDLVGGVGAKLIWRADNNLLVVGGEYEHDELKNDDLLALVVTDNRKVDRWALYLNDTATFGPVSIIPGARFDRTVSNGDQFSPSLGVVIQLNNSTMVRGYTASGFSLISLRQGYQTEKVRTNQLGFETTAIPYLWLKGTLFSNETRNVRNRRNLNFDPVTGAPIAESRTANGYELDLRTTPILYTSLGIGYTFTDSFHADDGSQVYADPRHTVQLALRYDDRTYNGIVTGRHVYWNSVPGYGGQYRGLIWDLHLGATILKRENSSMELFISGHNLFNGKQFQDELTPNAPRWYEGGLRVNF